MAENNIATKRFTIEYLAGLGIIALVSTAYFIGFNRLNDDLASLTLFGNHVMEMNRAAEELHSFTVLLDVENVPEMRGSIALSILAIAGQFGPQVSSTENLLKSMNSSVRSKVLNSTAYGENYIWPYRRVFELALEMEIVRKLERKGVPIKYVNSNGRTYSITDPEPMTVMANKVASPYLNFIKSARKEQRVFLNRQTVEHSAQMKLFSTIYLAAIIVTLLLIGLLLFVPMPKVFGRLISLLNNNRLIPQPG